MALAFPSTPTVGDTHTTGALSWRWDGVKWVSDDTLPSAPPPDAFEVDGGVAATDYIGTLQIDFGGAS